MLILKASNDFAAHENEVVDSIKTPLREVLISEKVYTIDSDTRLRVVYALLELAVELSPKGKFFIEAAHDVCSIFDENPERILRDKQG